MIILNTTFHTHVSVSEEFLKWVRTDYVASARESGLLERPVIARLLLEVEPDTASYAVQFSAPTKEVAVEWHDGAGAALRDRLVKRFGMNVVFFTTYMEELPL